MSRKEPGVKIILHGVKSGDELPINALKAAMPLLDAEEGKRIGIRFGEQYFSVCRYKQSVSVWQST